MSSTLAVSGGASIAVLGLYVLGTVLEQIGKGALLRLCTLLPFDMTALSAIAPLSVTGQCRDRITSAQHQFLVLGIFLLGLIVGSALTYCACVRREFS